MSGFTLSRVLADRFDAIRRSEIERLEKKLRGLSDVDRQSIDAITADVICAIARVPEMVDEAPPESVDAVVRLFALDPTN